MSRVIEDTKKALKQCEIKCPSTEAMLEGKLWKSRKVKDKEDKEEVKRSK